MNEAAILGEIERVDDKIRRVEEALEALHREPDTKSRVAEDVANPPSLLDTVSVYGAVDTPTLDVANCMLRANSQMRRLAVQDRTLDAPSASSFASGFVVEGDRQGAVREAIAARGEADRMHRRDIARKYMEHRSEWIRNVNKPTARSKHRRDIDRYLLMTTRGADLISAGRTGSGRVTSKPSSGHPDDAGPSEVDIILNEIEAAGGTAGGQERWGRNLAMLPGQNPKFVSSAGLGSVLIEDPLQDHYALRARSPWTAAERLTFLERWVAHGKNFRKIASFLDDKTVYDVHRFYFQHKNRLNLRQLAKEFSMKRKGLPSKKDVLLALSRDPSDPTTARAIATSSTLNAVFGAETEDEDGAKDACGVWSEQETNLMFQGLVRHGLQFDKLAAAVPGKTREQCHAFYRLNRQKYRLDIYGPAPTGPMTKRLKRGLQTSGSDWSKAEQQEFSRNLKRFGKDWKRISEYMPHRSVAQLKQRWQETRQGRGRHSQIRRKSPERSVDASEAGKNPSESGAEGDIKSSRHATAPDIAKSYLAETKDAAGERDDNMEVA